MTAPPSQPARQVNGVTGQPALGDEALNVRLAASPDTTPEVLLSLAADPRVTVRAAVAMNDAAPAGAQRLLAGDADERVRALLARRLATLWPETDSGQRGAIRDQALAMLSWLVEDEALRVRSAIAEIVKDMPEAPRELILRLARDAEVQVSEPVIRLSPLLTQEDLLGLIAQQPAPGALSAIARRARVDEKVSDAVAATADNAAIAALLRNNSAAIREATLDALVARAATVEEWHDPLVRRPRLSARAARALSAMVAGNLLGVLADRADLDPGLAAELRLRLAERLAPGKPVDAPEQLEADGLYAQARALQAKGRLSEATVVAAARRGDARACAALLAVAADVPLAVVERAVTLRSPKAILSLAWAARFSMRSALPLQSLLGGLAPDALLHPNRSGDYPLAEDEMRWQLELLKGTGPKRD